MNMKRKRGSQTHRHTHRKTVSLGGQIALSAAYKKFQWWILSSGCFSRGHCPLTCVHMQSVVSLRCLCRCESKLPSTPAWKRRVCKCPHASVCETLIYRQRGESSMYWPLGFFQTNYHCFETRRWHTHLPACSSFSPAQIQTQTYTKCMSALPCVANPNAWCTGLPWKKHRSTN